MWHAPDDGMHLDTHTKDLPPIMDPATCSLRRSSDLSLETYKGKESQHISYQVSSRYPVTANQFLTSSETAEQVPTSTKKWSSFMQNADEW